MTTKTKTTNANPNPHKWYLLHINAGSEKSVRKLIEEQLSKRNMANLVTEILVPTENVTQINKKGEKVSKEQCFYPGYIFMKMDLNDDLFSIIRSVPKIFAQGKDTIRQIPEREITSIKSKIQQGGFIKGKQAYHTGDRVKIKSGSFQSFIGRVVETLPDAKIKIEVTIFGKEVMTEVDIQDIELE